MTDHQQSEGAEGAEAVEGAENGKTPKGNSKRAEYQVFWCSGDYADVDEAVENGAWSYGGQFWSETNGGQRSARRQAVEADSDTGATLRDLLESGEPVFFFCVPMRSMHPFRAHQEEQAPKLVV